MTANLFSIVSKYTAILLDAAGVFWSGGRAGLYPGVLKTFAALKADGKIIAIISNSTMLADYDERKFAEAGLIKGIHYDLIMTSGQVLHELLQESDLPFPTPKKKYWVLFGEHPRYGSPHNVIFANTCYSETQDVNEADFIYIGIPQLNNEDQSDPQIFYPAVSLCLETKLPMICGNPDKFVKEGEPPRLLVRQGSIAAIYESMGGQVYYFGKPYRYIFERVLKILRLEYSITKKSTILMIGDGPATDIRGGNLMGIDTALIIKTGIAANLLSHHRNTNDFLKELAPTDCPTYLIERFSQ